MNLDLISKTHSDKTLHIGLKISLIIVSKPSIYQKITKKEDFGLAVSELGIIIMINIHAKILYFNIIPAETDSLSSFWFQCAFISFESSVSASE